VNYIECKQPKEQKDLEVKDYSHLLAKDPIQKSVQELEKTYAISNSTCQIKQVFMFFGGSGLSLLRIAVGLGNQIQF